MLFLRLRLIAFAQALPRFFDVGWVVQADRGFDPPGLFAPLEQRDVSAQSLDGLLASERKCW